MTEALQNDSDAGLVCVVLPGFSPESRTEVGTAGDCNGTGYADDGGTRLSREGRPWGRQEAGESRRTGGRNGARGDAVKERWAGGSMMT